MYERSHSGTDVQQQQEALGEEVWAGGECSPPQLISMSSVLKSAALSCEVPIKFHLVLISDMAQWISAFTSLSDNL